MLKVFLFLLTIFSVYSQSQTATVFQPLPEETLPFRIVIEEAPFSLPVGLQSYVSALYKDEWLLLGGRTGGLHGFLGEDTFPVSAQNSTVFVINFTQGTIISRSLLDPSSELTREQIDQLSVTNALFFQGDNAKDLYMVGGYGINTATGLLETKSVLTAIDVAGLIRWVKKGSGAKSAAKCLRQTSDPLLQVTGGVMWQFNGHSPALLGMGQIFTGKYTSTKSTGQYTYQVRPFQIIDTGKNFLISPYDQFNPISTYRRRDINIVPAMKKVGSTLEQYLVAFGGVFTPGADFGSWTVPIEIFMDGSSRTFDPNDPNTFKQGMNIYTCPNFGMFSEKTGDFYTLFFGGISYLYSINGGSNVAGGAFCLDPGIGFSNDVSTVRVDSSGRYSQYLMSATFPQIPTTFGTCAPFTTNPPTCASVASESSPVLLFGSSAYFLGLPNLPYYPNSLLALDKLKGSSPILLGYIVGGIASSAAETCSEFGDDDTRISRRIFSVKLILRD